MGKHKLGEEVQSHSKASVQRRGAEPAPATNTDEIITVLQLVTWKTHPSRHSENGVLEKSVLRSINSDKFSLESGLIN